MECKFCKAVESKDIDFYTCDECESVMCHNCMYTSLRGRDYCIYCKRNLQIEGRKL